MWWLVLAMWLSLLRECICHHRMLLALLSIAGVGELLWAQRVCVCCVVCVVLLFFFQAEDGIRDLVRSRGLGDVYKRQAPVDRRPGAGRAARDQPGRQAGDLRQRPRRHVAPLCLSLIHI